MLRVRLPKVKACGGFEDQASKQEEMDMSWMCAMTGGPTRRVATEAVPHSDTPLQRNGPRHTHRIQLSFSFSPP
nr:unnamed protein product [Digitaria exilis]